MPTTFFLFELGLAPIIDTIEGNTRSENHAALNGLTFGNAVNPVAMGVAILSPDPAGGPGLDGNAATYNANNAVANEGFLINGGPPRIFDAAMIYANTVLTYTDGTTASVSAIVMQDTDGRLYLLPPTSGPNAYSNALEAKPILSVTLGTAQPSGGTGVYNMGANRYDLNLPDGIIEGTANGDLIDATYIGDPQGERVDNRDNFQGNDDDLIFAYGGNDTIRSGRGNDTVDAGTGNDLVEGGTGNDSLLGGDGNDTLYGGGWDDTLDGGDGDDLIYGDGPGTADAVLVAHEDFTGGASGWSNNITSSDGRLNEFLGRFAGTNGDASGGPLVQKTFTLAEGYRSVIVEFDLLVIDSWDGNGVHSTGPYFDAFQLYVNGQEITSELFIWNSTSLDGARSGTVTLGGVTYTYSFTQTLRAELGFAPTWTDQIWRVRLEAENYTGEQFTLGFGATTGQGVDDESFGIDNLTILSTNNTLIDIADATGHDEIFGGTGDDTIFGGAGHDTIFGGADNDSISGDFGDDLILGGPGDDTILGGLGDDTLDGGDGDDLIYGDGPGTADAVLVAHEDFTGGASGWSNNITSSDGRLNEFLGRFAGTNGDASGGPLVQKTFTLAEGYSAVVAEFDLLVIDSWDGNGVHSTGPYFDAFQLYVNGQEITSELFIWNSTSLDGARSGTVTLDGVTYTYSFIQTLRAELGFAPNWTDQIWRVRLEAENYTGEQFTLGFGATTGQGVDDESFGIDNLTILSTNDASIDISQTPGNDQLFGGAGHDTIFGGAGNDSIMGGDGDDLIIAGPGNDTVAGGLGNDTFVFNPGDGLLVITDFNTGNTGTLNDGDQTNNDFIDLSGFYDNIAELQDDFADDGILNQSNTGNVVWGQVVDYSNNTRFAAGDGIVFEGAAADGTSFTRENTGVVCFTPGTMILTDRGERPIQHLRRGDRIVTRDNGVQRLEWVARRRLGRAELDAQPQLRPILIAPGLIGASAPLLVSPQHGVLIRGDDQPETLVRAIHLARLRGGRARVANGMRQVTYIHLMFSAHQIVFANGAPSESFYPGPMALKALSDPARHELKQIFPALFSGPALSVFGPRARHVVRRSELPDHLSEIRAA